MASVRALAPVKLGGKWHPPGSVLHGIEDVQARAWGNRVEFFADAVEAAPGSPVTAAKPIGLPLAPEQPAPVSEPPSEAEEEEETRVDQVRAAIDLLDPADFTATGRPKVGPLGDVLGFRPTADEITTALALREDGGV